MRVTGTYKNTAFSSTCFTHQRFLLPHSFSFLSTQQSNLIVTHHQYLHYFIYSLLLLISCPFFLSMIQIFLDQRLENHVLEPNLHLSQHFLQQPFLQPLLYLQQKKNFLVVHGLLRFYSSTNTLTNQFFVGLVIVSTPIYIYIYIHILSYSLFFHFLTYHLFLTLSLRLHNITHL